MQSQWPTVIIKHTFKSCTDREDTGPWRGLHCVNKDQKKRRSLHARLGVGEKPALIVLPPTLMISPIDISFKGCKGQQAIACPLCSFSSHRLRARAPDAV